MSVHVHWPSSVSLSLCRSTTSHFSPCVSTDLSGYDQCWNMLRSFSIYLFFNLYYTVAQVAVRKIRNYLHTSDRHVIIPVTVMLYALHLGELLPALAALTQPLIESFSSCFSCRSCRIVFLSAGTTCGTLSVVVFALYFCFCRIFSDP